MLLPPLPSTTEFLAHAKAADFRILNGPLDISANVSKTWRLTWELVQKPAVWAFAVKLGRDGVAYLHSFRAMKRGYANGTLRYIVVAWTK